MSSQQSIQINVNPINPAQYLACCGVFEIVARFDSASVIRWETGAATWLLIETMINEGDLVDCVIKTFTNWKNYWHERFFENTTEVTRVDVSFALSDELHRIVKLDWWYERLNADGSFNGNNSAWKMFSGNQSVRQVVDDRLIPSCRKLHSEMQTVSLAELFNARTLIKGQGFGFNPSSSRNALDVGYSPNDLHLDVATYPFVELLAMIGAQHFFPPRTRPSGGHESTRGFMRDKRKIYFQHCLWRENLPVVLARAYACGSLADERSGQLLQSERASRDKYSNLSPSTLTHFEKGKAND